VAPEHFGEEFLNVDRLPSAILSDELHEFPNRFGRQGMVELLHDEFGPRDLIQPHSKTHCKTPAIKNPPKRRN
jgi:hypothetical protein